MFHESFCTSRNQNATRTPERLCVQFYVDIVFLDTPLLHKMHIKIVIAKNDDRQYRCM